MSDSSIENSINDLKNGSAICLLGAGFSLNATDGYGDPVPSTSDLEQEICEMIGISKDEGGSLSDLAEYCQSNPDLGAKFRELLIRRLTMCEATPDQNKVLRAPWRAVFTTNFDDIVERAYPELYTVFTPTTTGKRVGPKKTPLYYMHGRALDILENEQDPGLVVSESNYLDLKEENSNLYEVFINEVVCASQIYFIGYSLRDMEIAKRLFKIDESIQTRSVVISRPNESQVAVSRLEKFGTVHPIGVAGFAEKLPETFPDTDRAKLPSELAFVKPSSRVAPAQDVTDSDVDRLILAGDFDSACYAAQLGSGESGHTYCVDRRAKIESAFEAVDNGVRRRLITSDIGNGKTVFLKQLEYDALHNKNYEVYRIDTNLTDMFKELDHLVRQPVKRMFIIDDLQRHQQAAKFIGERLNGLSVLVCSTRNSVDNTDLSKLETTLGGRIREIDVNVLDSEELKQWEKLLERYGYWEQRIKWSQPQRLDFLKKDCAAENRSIVLSIFKTSRVAQQVSEIVDFFLRRKPQHKRAFVAILISALCQNHVEWERVVNWLNINQTQLKRDIEEQAVFSFMQGRRQWFMFSSSQLADYIFKNHDFSDELLVDVYTTIVNKTAHSANDYRSGFDSAENIKELMKYWFLRLLFGNGEPARKSIEAVYSRLSKIERIRNNPQFWLQWAMSKMEIGHLDGAERYIETALGKAKDVYNDDFPTQIIDQRVRLFLLKNARQSGEPNFSEIETAVSDLKKLMKERGDEIVYPIRASKFILEFVEEKIDYMSAELRDDFRAILKEMNSNFGSDKMERTRRGETGQLREFVRKSIMVINNG